eukprot:2529827-Amphidinium_carterae.2
MPSRGTEAVEHILQNSSFPRRQQYLGRHAMHCRCLVSNQTPCASVGLRLDNCTVRLPEVGASEEKLVVHVQRAVGLRPVKGSSSNPLAVLQLKSKPRPASRLGLA